MAKPKKSGLRDRISRKPSADAILYGDEPASQNPGTPASRDPSIPITSRRTGTPVPRPAGKPLSRAARGVKKKTYTLPLESIERIDKLHAEFFSARPGQEPIEKSQIASAALQLGLADTEALRRVLYGDELDDLAAGE